MESGTKSQQGFWRYEYTVLVTFWLITGFVAIDRFVIAFLLPLIAPELHLDNTQIGMAMSAVAITWAFSSIFFGNFSDRIGRKAIIIPATIAFSVLSWVTGLAQNFAQLMGIRALLGIPEGAYLPAAVATLAEVSPPEKRGLFLGLHLCAFASIGATLGPLYATIVGPALGWRVTIMLTIIPGILLSLFVWRFVKEPPSILARRQAAQQEIKSQTHSAPTGWSAALKYRNVLVAALGLVFVQGCSWTIQSFGTLFLTNMRHLDLALAGSVIAIYGVGQVIGFIVLPWASDTLGRKVMGSVPGLIAGVAGYCFVAFAGSDYLWLAITFFCVGFFGQGLYTMFVSVIPAESVPVMLIGGAIGFVLFISEFVGGAAMPTIGGILGDAFGLQGPMLFAAGCIFIAGLCGFFFKETAPRVVAKRQETVANATK